MSEIEQDVGSIRADLTELATLSSAVTHVLINAYSAVVNTVEAVLLEPQGLPAAELEGYAARMIEACMRASDIARRFTDFANARAPVRLEPGRLDRLAAEAVERARRVSPRGVAWDLELAATEPVEVDPAQAAIVLDALLRNAWEAVSESGGRVAVRARQDAARGATLEIADSGPGMPKAIQERAFEPFFSTKPGHAGIGLSVAKALWRRLRGTLIVESASPGGTVIRLTLMPPVVRAAPAAPEPAG